MSGKICLSVLAVLLCAQVARSEVLAEKEQEWRKDLEETRLQQLRQAQDSAAQQLQANLITTLNGLSQSAANAGTNVTTAIAVLTQAVIANTFDLAGAVAYMPRLLLLDLPTQFVEVLRIMRRQQTRVPSNVNNAIDTVTDFTRQSQASGISDQLFAPVVRFLPNMLNGVQTFLQTIIGSVFGFLGAANTNALLL